MSDRKLHVKILLSHVDVGAEKKRFEKITKKKHAVKSTNRSNGK